MILNEDQKREITELLQGNLEQQATIAYFTQKQPSIELPVQVEVKPCEYCEETEQLLRELTALSDRLKLEVYDFTRDKDKAEQFGISDVPALAVVGNKDYGIRYYGIPSGYEFTTLLDVIINASKRRTKLSDDTRKVIDALQKPVNIKVFVTPT